MSEESGEFGDTTLVERRHFNVRPSWWLAAAAILFLALWGWRELDIRRMRESIESERAEIRALSEENQHLTQRNEHIIAAVAHEPQTISLSGSRAPGAAGKVFIDPKGGHAVVMFSDLPPNGVSKQYQIWITSAKAEKPQSAGVFAVPPSGETSLILENVPPAAEIKSFGVTLEAKGGTGAPSGEYVLVGKP